MKNRLPQIEIAASNKDKDSQLNQGARKRQHPLSMMWSPELSWRNRGGSEKKFLSSLERRYLRDVLWALERSNKPVTSEFVLHPQGGQFNCPVVGRFVLRSDRL